MDVNDKKQLPSSVGGLKRGVPMYRTNPSVPDADSIKKQRRVRFGDDKKGFVVDTASGEVLSVGGAGFYEFEEVDNTRFVKLFLEGIKQATGLSKAGLAVFELVYHQVQKAPGTDEIKISHFLANDSGINERAYRRGIKELIDREFLYKSLMDGVFFVNIRYMFNGDRLAFVKGYRRKSAVAAQQNDLFAITSQEDESD
jgi:hypothetical protein